MDNYQQLLTFRFILGFFGSTSVVAMAAITDAVPSQSKSKYLSMISAIIMLSYVIGPIVGAGLAEYGLRIPFFASSAAGALGFIFALIFLQETHQNEQHNQQKSKQAKDIFNNNEPQNNGKIPIQIWIFCISIIMIASILYVIDTYHLSTLYVGYVTLSVMLIIAFSNLTFVKGLQYLGMYIQTIIACFCCGIVLLIVPLINNLWIFLAVFIFGFGLPVSWTNINNRGFILGITNSAAKVSLIVGPLFAGLLYEIDKSYLWYVASANSLLAAFIIIIIICVWPKSEMANSPKTEYTKQNGHEPSINISVKDIGIKQKMYKELISKNLETILSSNRIKQLLNQLSLNKYKFLIAKQQHLERILNLLSNQYSLYNPPAVLCNIPKHRIYHLMKPSLIKKINLGKCLISMDNDRVIASICFEDYYDDINVVDKTATNNNQLTQNEQHLFEILSLPKQDQFVKQQLKSLANNQYGSLFVNSFVCRDYEYKSSKFLYKFLHLLCIMITDFDNKDNTYSFANGTNCKLFKTATNIFNGKILKSFDYAQYIFNDGTNLNYYFDQIKDKKNKNNLKENCKIAALIYESKDIHLMIQNLSNHCNK